MQQVCCSQGADDRAISYLPPPPERISGQRQYCDSSRIDLSCVRIFYAHFMTCIMGVYTPIIIRQYRIHSVEMWPILTDIIVVCVMGAPVPYKQCGLYLHLGPGHPPSRTGPLARKATSVPIAGTRKVKPVWI